MSERSSVERERNGFHAHDLAEASDVHVAGLRDLLRQGNYEFNLTANFEVRFGEEIQALVADVSGLRAQLGTARLARKNPKRQAHGESPRNAAFRSVAHQAPC